MNGTETRRQPPRPTEEELVRLAKAGDPDSFDALVRLYQGRVLRLCRRMFRRHELAEEAAQETFLAAYRSLSAFAGRSSFGVWLFSVTYRTCLRLLRKERGRRGREVELESEALELLPDQHGRPPDAALLGARLDREVAGLPPRMRMAVLLHYKEELPLAEVAQTLNCPVGTVKTLLFRGRRAIRLALEGEAAHGL